MITQTCFLLSYVKYGDNGAVLTCFSKDQGFQSFFASNIYSPRNKKKSYLFPLNEIQITVAPKKSGSGLPTVSRIETADQLYEFESVKINSILFFVSDFLFQVLREEQNYERIYIEIKNFMKELYAENMDSYISFIFKILEKQGISPLVSAEVFLNPEIGTFSSQKSMELFDEEISTIWKDYLQSENLYSIKLNRNLRKKMLDSLMSYYGTHFHGFREPISLAVIQQIYD
ncbi:DNA repair protein RecO [Chryseobacterium sp. MP_3.2]|uniref:DNA repair protein RecO n=1 Tax=Chryseobacterium sp. MP_3.2 TaxID=3071712 RepID=UPI002DFA6AD2|nr:DNA repair protein RecO (recombination protein O) [Chryseobacterium sp. MP_3.2]